MVLRVARKCVVHVKILRPESNMHRKHFVFRTVGDVVRTAGAGHLACKKRTGYTFTLDARAEARLCMTAGSYLVRMAAGPFPSASGLAQPAAAQLWRKSRGKATGMRALQDGVWTHLGAEGELVVQPTTHDGTKTQVTTEKPDPPLSAPPKCGAKFRIGTCSADTGHMHRG